MVCRRARGRSTSESCFGATAKPVRLPAWLVLGSWFVLQYLYASGAGVSNGAGVAYVAHVVGFVFGVLVGLGVRRTGTVRAAVA